jgi:hypothetical protein
MASEHAKNPSKHVTEARAAAQRVKLNAQAAQRQRAAEHPSKTKGTNGQQGQRDLLSRRRAQTTVVHAIDDYLADHEGRNSSLKTLQWHQTALGLLRTFLEQERGLTLVGEVLVCRPAQDPGQPRQGACRAHGPDLCALGTRLLPLAGDAGGAGTQPF